MPDTTPAVADETLIRFARRISHDLNNFSTVVRTYSELLLSELPADSPTHADVTEIQRAAESMVQYLQRVTRFARAAGMKKAPVPVDAVVAETVDAFRREVPTRTIAIAGTTGTTINADPVWFREVLTELLRNAHEVAPADTPVEVHLSMANQTVRIEVQDSGPGFAASLPSIGEPFLTTKNGVRGAGLGLALANAFAMALGGKLEAQREIRTRVSLVLPTA
ncbi:MAG: HAMP domain-containing histidine kinase [Gemmatimonadaceae bacterium]|nr:HAMP domain-containing histidine kinase [Gemmatimonadaceae bacterium]